MYSASFLVLALAVFGASANCVLSNVGMNGMTGMNVMTGLNGMNGLTGMNVMTGLNGLNGLNGLGALNTGMTTAVASAPVVEAPTVRLPSVVTPASVQEACNCVNTVVRPHVRKEVYSFPSVQRFVQTTSTPIVETVPYVTGSATDVPTASVPVVAQSTGVTGVGVVSGVNSGFGGLVSGMNSGLTGVVSGLNNVNVVSGVNSGFGGLVSGVSSGCGCGNNLVL